MAEQINVASLIISIIILIIVVILIFMVCYYYSTNNNNSTKSIQNPQALAAAALYKNANKNNFANHCSLFRISACCTNKQIPGKCEVGSNCNTNNGTAGCWQG